MNHLREALPIAEALREEGRGGEGGTGEFESSLRVHAVARGCVGH